MDDSEKFLSRVAGILWLADVALFIALSASWIGLLGGWWWFFDLFAHFRIQYLIASGAGFLWFLGRESKVGMAFSGLSLLLNSFLLFGPPIVGDNKVSDRAAPKLRVASINVLTSNRSTEKVLNYIRQMDADVVFLMEVDYRWEHALAPLKETYPHSLIEAREDNFGVAFFSNVAGTQARIEYLGEIGVPTVVAELQFQGQHLQFIGTHPVPPSGRDNSQARDEQLEDLREFARHSRHPALLVGDLNATPWSAGMRILTKAGHLKLPSARLTWQPTWRAASPFAISIDHALASSPLTILRRDVGPDLGSDHRPIFVEVGWPD